MDEIIGTIIIGNVVIENSLNTQTKKYKVIEKLGEGGFGICYKVHDIEENNKEYALKVISKDKIKENNYEEALNNVKNIQVKLKNDNIVRLYYVFEDNLNVYAVLELCQNGDLHNLLFNKEKGRKKLKEIEVQYYIINLIKALEYIHIRKIVHLDLKLQNILLNDKMELKLADFGLAAYIDKINFIKGGTPNYMAPEAFEEYKESNPIKKDIWAIGIIMYYLLIGKLPFDDSNKEKLKEKIKKIEYKFPDDVIISKAAQNLIQQILVLSPENRPSLKYIKEHEFFKLGEKIPKLLPTRFLKFEPSLNYIRNFMKDADDNGIVNKKEPFTNLIQKEKEDNELEERKRKEKEEEKIAKLYKYKQGSIYVTDYVNHSGHYGLGYKLNNDIYGACFNDSTKILYEDGDDKFLYIIKDENLKEYKKYYYYLKDSNRFSHDIHKKYILLKKFIKEIEKGKETSVINETKEENENKEENINEFKGEEYINDDIIFIKRFRKYDKESILFQLNNDDIQILFNNKDIVILALEKNKIIDMIFNQDNNKYDTSEYTKQEIFESKDNVLKKKIKYINNLIEKMKEEAKNV